MTLTLKMQDFLKLIYIPNDTHSIFTESQVLILIIDKNGYHGKPMVLETEAVTHH